MGNNLLSAPTGKNDWNTPEKYLHMARDVMGSIDCDPASSDFAQEMVKAKQHFTLEDNGLEQDWIGNVWLNPPYSYPAIEHFSRKLINEIRNRNTEQAIVLTNAASDTQWFKFLFTCCNCVCFKTGRIAFLDSTGKAAGRGAHGSVFFYIGRYIHNCVNAERFRKVFSSEGIIIDRTNL